MKKEHIPVRFLYRFLTGAIGKQFVIKHYRYGTIKTKYPDMTRIVASKAQLKCRNLFREAVVYAQAVLADPVKFSEWQKRTRLKPRYRVFTKIIRYYILEAKEAIIRRKNATNRLIQKCFTTQTQPNETGIKSGYEIKEGLKDHHLLKREHLHFLHMTAT